MRVATGIVRLYPGVRSGRRSTRVESYILIQVVPRSDRTETMRGIERLAGVEKVEAVAGPFDLIAKARSVDPSSLRREIHRLCGVLHALHAPVVAVRSPEHAAA
jgi:hypothetical protein